MGESASDDADGVDEGELVRIQVRLQRRFVEQAAEGEMREEQAVELLSDQIRGLAPQHDARSSQMGFELIKRGLDLPTLRVEGGASSWAGAAVGSSSVVTRR